MPPAPPRPRCAARRTLCALALRFLFVLLAVSQSRPADAQFAAENRKIVLKVNLGGGPVGDFLGEEQVLDVEDFAKNVARADIQNTDQAQIFQSQRFARSKDMTFRIPVPDGIYSVTLLFAETYEPACVPGGRVFDIALGTPVSGVTKIIDSFDVFQSAGCLSAHGKRFDKVPSKEGIVVHLAHKSQHPSLCGFIVEGFPATKGDGSEFRAIARDNLLDTPLGHTPVAASYSPPTANSAPDAAAAAAAPPGQNGFGAPAPSRPNMAAPGVGLAGGYGAPPYARAVRRRRRRRRLLSRGWVDDDVPADKPKPGVHKEPVSASALTLSAKK